MQALSGTRGFGKVATNSTRESYGVCVCVCGGKEASIHTTVCSGAMLSDASPQFPFWVGLGHTE